MLLPISTRPSRHTGLSKAIGVTAAILASTLAAASPAPTTVPTVIGTDLLSNNTDISNSTTATASITLSPSSETSSESVTGSVSILPIFSLSSTIAESSTASPTSTSPPKGVLALPLKHVELGKDLVSGSIARRYFSTEVLSVFSAAYLAQIRFPDAKGQETQVVDVLLDTGSFELFVNPVCASSDVPELCSSFGSYNSSASQRSVPLNKPFNIRYGGGSASGQYYKDDISLLPGTTLTQQQFGVANSSEKVWFGIMGLGQGRANNYLKYPLIVDNLKTQGYTESRLFSLELGPQPPKSNPIQYSGEIVFGGLDRNKFAGSLRKVPTDPNTVYYSIKLTSLVNIPASGVSQPVTRQANAQFPIPVIVDSGTTLSILPRSLVESLAAKFPGATYDGSGGYTVPCSYRDQKGSVTFGFGTYATVSVSYSDFIWVSGSTCYLGASWSASLGLNILGASFLRGAYVVFDQDNSALYMAPYQSCGGGSSNLVAVPEGVDAAAGIVGACAAAAITSSTTVTTATSTSRTTTTANLPLTSTTTTLATTTRSFTSTRISSSGSTFVTATRTDQESGAITGAPTTTITSTITKATTYTITSCPAAQRTAPCSIGALTTEIAVYVTEICLAHQGNGVFVEISPQTAAATAAAAAVGVTAAAASATPPVTITILQVGDMSTTCTDDAQSGSLTVRPITAAAAGTTRTSTSSCTDDELAVQGNTLTVRPVTAVAAGTTRTTTSSCTDDDLTAQGRSLTVHPITTQSLPTVAPITAVVAGKTPATTTTTCSSSFFASRPLRTATDVSNVGEVPVVTPLANFVLSPSSNTSLPTTQATTNTSVLPLVVLSSAAGDHSRGVRAARDDAGVFGKVDVKLAAGVIVAILGAWL